MADNENHVATRERLWRAGLALLPGLALVLLRGVDTNWDLRNYHLYNPHAWWTGRMAIDIAPAQLQTWHNPLLDLPLYLIVQSGWDLRWASAWLTLPFAIAIYLLLGLQARLSAAPVGRGAQVVLALLALSGATVWATVGNSMNDGFVAAGLLGALALVADPEAATPPRWFLAGLVAGAIAGLKLTAGTYCIALAVCALLYAGAGWTRRGHFLLALGAGGLLGFLATYGWWGWTLLRDFGNPFFPYYNDFFGSPSAAARDFADARFRADGLLDALTVPLQLLRDDSARSELYLRDPRLLAGALGLPALAWFLRWREPAQSAQARVLAVFFWTALPLWALQYGIYRYVALLELLGALVIVAWVSRVPRWRGVALAVTLVLVSKATHRPDWGHAHAAPPRFGLTALPLPSDALVVTTTGDPLAYVALGLPANVPMLGLGNNFMSPGGCSGLEDEARARLAGHRGGIWVLGEQPLERGQRLEAFGLVATDEPCLAYPNVLGRPWLCPVSAEAVMGSESCRR